MTEGFYKYEPPILLYGKWVLDANYQLFAETKDDYEYPIDGWYWFYSQEEAHSFFKINKKIKEVEEESIN